jgi:hypothetical protein
MWYVYSYSDPCSGRVFYIGKGKDNRCKAHLYRAKTWVNRGKPAKCGSHNLHLLRLISKIWDRGEQPVVEIIKQFDNEQNAYSYEIEMIKYHKDTICNLTDGGEGFKGHAETRLKMSEKRKEWLKTDKGQAWRKMMSEARKGSKNPHFGKKEEEEHKRSRMKNMLEKERWNKGRAGDPRCKGHPKGELPHNARPCRAVNELSGEAIEESSIGRLAKRLVNNQYQISHSSISRIIDRDKTINGWRISYVIPRQ